MINPKLVYWAILSALILILYGSANHLAYSFGTLELEGINSISLAVAIGLEAAMLGIAFGVTERRRKKERYWDLIIYLIIFGMINFYGNMYHSISVFHAQKRYITMEDVMNLDKFVLLTIAVFSGSLPFLTLSLTELLSIFGLRFQGYLVTSYEVKPTEGTKEGGKETLQEDPPKLEIRPRRRTSPSIPKVVVTDQLADLPQSPSVDELNEMLDHTEENIRNHEKSVNDAESSSKGDSFFIDLNSKKISRVPLR